MVAGRDGGHPGGALLVGQRGDGVVGAAELERADALQVLGLQEHLRAGRLVERARGQHRRAVGDASIRRAAAWTSSSAITGPPAAGAPSDPPSRRAAAEPRAANAAATSSASARSRPGDHQPLGRPLHQRGDLEQQRPHEVRGHGRRPRARRAAQVAARRLDLDAVVARAVARRRPPRPPRRRTRAPASKPSFAAAIASTPEPQPQSASGAAGGSPISSASDSRVVSWAPVPNAWRGLDRDVDRARRLRLPRRAHAQVGPTSTRPGARCASARPSRRRPRWSRRRRARRRRPPAGRAASGSSPGAP